MRKQIVPITVFSVAMCVMLLMPELCFASLDSSLRGIKTQLTGVILPVISVIGLAIAALSFFSGNPQAKQHIFYAILGCCFGFGAQAIVDLIQATVR